MMEERPNIGLFAQKGKHFAKTSLASKHNNNDHPQTTDNCHHVSSPAQEMCSCPTDGDGSSPQEGDPCLCPTDADAGLDLEALEARFPYRAPGQHNHHGIPMSGMSPPDRLRDLESFKVQEDDILISGYPKSGTTWLEEIVYLIQNNGDVTLSNKTPVYMRVPYLEGQYDGLMIDHMPQPRMYKTHLPHRLLPSQIIQKKPKIVHILRSPRDTVVSYFHFYRTLTELGKYHGTWSDFLAMFSEGFVCYGDWFRHTRDWWSHHHDDNVLVVTYESMKREPELVIGAIATFCGKSLDQDTLDRIMEHTSFDNMKTNPMLNFKGVPSIDESISTFMRKGIVGDWKNHFTVAQNEEFQSLLQDKIGDLTSLPYSADV